MELYKPFISLLLFIVFFTYYKKIKKCFILLFILLRRVKFVNNKKISNTDNENSKTNTDRLYTPHDYSSEEEEPPSPNSFNKNFKKD
jgi:hypothetical protein